MTRCNLIKNKIYTIKSIKMSTALQILHDAVGDINGDVEKLKQEVMLKQQQFAMSLPM